MAQKLGKKFERLKYFIILKMFFIPVLFWSLGI